MSGRKLGSESYTILSHDNPDRKTSTTSTIAPIVNGKDSCVGIDSPKSSIEVVRNSLQNRCNNRPKQKSLWVYNELQ